MGITVVPTEIKDVCKIWGGAGGGAGGEGGQTRCIMGYVKLANYKENLVTCYFPWFKLTFAENKTRNFSIVLLIVLRSDL